jgi:competence protein ComEA
MSLVERLYRGLRVSAGLGLLLLILPGNVSPPEPETITPQFGSGIVNVYVSGAVRKPGVYRFPVGTRTVQAIQQAGGVLPGTPTETLELTQILHDGQRLHISPKPTPAPVTALPVEPAGAPAPARRGRRAGPGGARTATPVALNQASVDALDALPGIGHKRALDIVAYRRQHGGFRSVDDLRRIRGMGPKLMARLRPYLKL